MSETPNIQTIARSAEDPSHTEGIPDSPSGHPRHCYRIGVVGSKSSGKSCLLAALSMARNPNIHGYTATRIAVEDTSNADLCKGNEWADKATLFLENGKWPEPTPHERASVRFKFTDGLTRQKNVELIDYSGELLNPDVAQSELAKRLREVLREMDGLIVLAEYPLQGENPSKLEKSLNGLLGVFALLNVGHKKHPNTVTRQIPIAMIVNKWDRSPYFDTSPSGQGEACETLEKFLASEPRPFHASVASALGPAAGGWFKSFAVSAVGAVRREGAGDQVREMPPGKGTLASFGLEEPFLWVIQQRDDIDIAEQEQSLKRWFTWLLPPWPHWLRNHGFSALLARFDSITPEGARMTSIQRKSWSLVVRQSLICAMVVLVCEACWDGVRHRDAEQSIKNPGQGSGWQAGTAWLSDYGRSNQLRHMLYSTVFLSKQSALNRANQVWDEKDKEAFDSIPKLPQDGGPDAGGNLAEAEGMAREQVILFPNSPRNPERQEIIARVQTIRASQEFEKQLAAWHQLLDALRPEAQGGLQSKLNDLAALVMEIRDSKDVPMGGRLRDKWKAVLNETDSVRDKLVEMKTGKDLADKIRQAEEAEDYLKACDLLADEVSKPTFNPQSLTDFRLKLPKWVNGKCETLSKQGENWEGAVQYAEQFLEPSRRVVVTDTIITSIKNTILNAKVEGDKYLYDLACENRNNETLDKYLQNAPLQSMVSEVDNYRNWLVERDKPRNLTFRAVEIKWANDQKKGVFGSTVLKLFVNGVGDERNGDKTDCPRAGVTADKQGIRNVSVDNLIQWKKARIQFQSWHVEWHVNGGERWDKLSLYDGGISPEALLTQPQVTDSANNQIRIAMTGALPEPLLSSWHHPE